MPRRNKSDELKFVKNAEKALSKKNNKLAVTKVSKDPYRPKISM